MKKRNLFSHLSNRGFTLVELMIVVAIIGILSTIAIPQYKKFQSRAKQSEARITLGGLQMAESGWAVDNESFTGCIGNIGFGREGSKFYYAIGFNGVATTGCGPAGSATCLAYRWNPDGSAAASCTDDANQTFFDGTVSTKVGSGTAKSAGKTDLPGTSVALSSFTAAAAGRISDTVETDVWHIDQAKNLRNTTMGY